MRIHTYIGENVDLKAEVEELKKKVEKQLKTIESLRESNEDLQKKLLSRSLETLEKKITEPAHEREDIFRKRPILGNRILVPIRDD